MLTLSRYLAQQAVTFRARFPLVLMLEPTHKCNLACAGCGRIREYRDTLNEMMSAEECLAAARECGAPVVAVTGGEPLLHPELPAIIHGLTGPQKRFVYLCTNGLLLEKTLPRLTPGPRLSLNVHLDGIATSHDAMAGRAGVFDTAVAGIAAAKAAGFGVCTNTTIYKSTDIAEIRALFDRLTALGVDGLLVSPGFDYEAVGEDVFLERQEVHQAFQQIWDLSRRYRLYNTPLYLDFLRGNRPLQCTPWGNPTRNPRGWKQPCYLITDGHCASFKDLMESTDWSRYGNGRDPRCAHCMVHSGFEATVVRQVMRSPAAMLQMARWSLFS